MVERIAAGTAAGRTYCISVFEITYTEQKPGADSLIIVGISGNLHCLFGEM